MKGRRVPIPKDGNVFGAVEKAGDYCGPVEGTIPNPVKGAPPILVRRVAFILPIGRDSDVHGGGRSVCHVNEPPHKFTEEPDGSLTITASILATWRDQTGDQTWHGYLTKGEWITA